MLPCDYAIGRCLSCDYLLNSGLTLSPFYLCAFMAIIVFEARAISGRRLRQGFPQSNSDRNSQKRATRHAVYQESQNSFHTPL